VWACRNVALPEGDVPCQGHDLGLLRQRNPSVVLFLAVEEAKDRIADRPDGCELPADQAVPFRELEQAAHELVPLLDDEEVGLCVPLLADDCGPGLFAGVRYGRLGDRNPRCRRAESGGQEVAAC
jgi:hypothetical protein